MSLLLIKNISELVQVEENEGFSLPVKGAQLKHLPTIKNAWLLIDGERIKDFGKMETCPTNISQVIDNEGKINLVTKWANVFSQKLGFEYCLVYIYTHIMDRHSP